ncbi:MAG TPA: hypothetical protein VMW51_11195 [Terriglobia bacterium]|nr:hypothetical protein [Terriglobia bacterium]
MKICRALGVEAEDTPAVVAASQAAVAVADFPVVEVVFRVAAVSRVAEVSPAPEGVAAVIQAAGRKEEAGRADLERAADRCGNPWRSA